MIKISPSILSANFAKLGEEITAIDLAGADMIHIDVMDGSFVPNITIGPAVIKSIREYTKLPFDVHLMVKSPEHLLEAFARSGSDMITIHLEATSNPIQAIKEIKKLGIKAGISLMPQTPADTLHNLVDLLDIILIMTVNPGFGGQEFMENQIQKIYQISDMVKQSNKPDLIISVDGGINPITAKKSKDAGANILVAGSYIFKHTSYKDAISTLR